MVASFILAAAFQGVGVPAPTVPMCSLVTPRGDAVGFQILPGNSVQRTVSLAPTHDSVWPTSTLTGGRSSGDPASSGESRVVFGGADGLLLEMSAADNSPRRMATLFRRDRRLGYPIAVGFCEQAGPFSVLAPTDRNDPAAVAAEIPAFDPRHWPEDRCGMLLTNGRRLPFRFMQRGPDEVAMVSSVLWAGRPVTARIRSARSFNGRNGLSGTQEFIVREREGIAVKLIRFRGLGDPSAGSHTAYAICGYTGIVRRPTRQ